ncbi:hypothetical protein D3C83_159780 [compost metagenome]
MRAGMPDLIADLRTNKRRGRRAPCVEGGALHAAHISGDEITFQRNDVAFDHRKSNLKSLPLR